METQEITNVLRLKGLKNIEEGKAMQKKALDIRDAFLLAEGKNKELFGKLQIQLSRTKDESDKIKWKM